MCERVFTTFRCLLTCQISVFQVITPILILVGYFPKPFLVCYVDVWGRNLVDVSGTSSLGII